MRTWSFRLSERTSIFFSPSMFFMASVALLMRFRITSSIRVGSMRHPGSSSASDFSSLTPLYYRWNVMCRGAYIYERIGAYFYEGALVR
jgi:hypothetical protein